jgi:hypothetical protein
LVPSFDAVKLIAVAPVTYSPVKPNVWSRIFCRTPLPDQRTSKLTCDGSGVGPPPNTALKKSW